MTTVQLSQGAYKGLEKDGVEVYHGIPYASTFSRFQPPEVPEYHGQLRDATSWGAVCPQLPSRLTIVMGPMPADSGAQDEHECGVLSVYKPAGEQGSTTKLPVIVFIHGGAFLTGSSENPQYDGSRLARDAQAVVVTINYRLGIFGLYHSDPDTKDLSPGMLDVVAAFKWIRLNISHFGGDAQNITGTGQSAGAFQIQCLLDYFPDLLDKAILQSCPAGVTFDAERRRAVQKIFHDGLPHGTTPENASVQQLLEAQRKTSQAIPGPLPPFWPNVSESLYRVSENKKSIMICWTRDDGNVFASLGGQDVDKRGPELTRNMMSDPSRRIGKRWQEDGHDVKLYEFTWAGEGFDLGATHCTDLPLLFGGEKAWSQAPLIGKTPWAEWDRQGEGLRRSWGTFARNGTHPSGSAILKEIEQ